jgi:hypothetical protein
MKLSLQRIAVPAALGGVLLAAYWNSLEGSFHYDDFHSILHNPHIRDLGNLPAFFLDPTRFSVDVDKAMYRPLLLVSYALNYAWGRYDETGYHLVSLLLHYGCVHLVWRIAGIAGCGPRAAVFAALLFALHPLASEPVNYISSRSELLGSLLFLAAFRWFLLDTARHRAVGVALFAMGLLSKEMVITLPLLLWLYQSWMAGAAAPRLRQHLAMWLVAAVYLAGLLLSGALSRSMAVIEASRLSQVSVASVAGIVGEQLWTQIKAAVFYLELLCPGSRRSGWSGR